MASGEEGAICKFVIEEKNQELVLVQVNVGIVDDESSIVNDFCRLCNKNMRSNGVISNSVRLFSPTVSSDLPLANKLAALGLVLKPCKGRSFRVCRHCTTTVGHLERDMAALQLWKDRENQQEQAETESDRVKGKRDRSTSPPPSEPPRPMKKLRKIPPNRGTSVTQVITNYPSKMVVKAASHREAGIINNLVRQRWRSSAKLISNHKRLLHELKSSILTVINQQCRTLMNRNNGFMLWKTSPEEVKSFLFDNLIADLERMSPFLLSIFKTISNNNINAACAALCIALRGREAHMTAFTRHINNIITLGGLKKAVFNRLAKECITTAYTGARMQNKKPAATNGEATTQKEPLTEQCLNTDLEKEVFFGARTD